VAAFWARSDVEWTGSQSAQQALRFSLFALLQGTARSEGHGVPSKGQTGTGYEGHYFWDTETYLLPFLIHTHPSVARSLLMHRIDALPAARERARQVSCDGALFPWRTINGDEASPYYAAGTAQYHINADIAYALNQYVHLTGDVDLMYGHGAELLVETARMWASLGFFSDRLDGEFVMSSGSVAAITRAPLVPAGPRAARHRPAGHIGGSAPSGPHHPAAAVSARGP
jgi:alpha,alpha-trehalose phosphorylase